MRRGPSTPPPLAGELIPGGSAGTLSPQDLEQLRQAVQRLENPSFGARVASVVGTPVEKLLGFLPRRANTVITYAARKAIGAALRVSLTTMDTRVKPEGVRKSSDWWHLGATAATGAVGGAFGLTALAVELPLTTTIMLRSIADIARSHGEDLRMPWHHSALLRSSICTSRGSRSQCGTGRTCMARSVPMSAMPRKNVDGRARTSERARTPGAPRESL